MIGRSSTRRSAGTLRSRSTKTSAQEELLLVALIRGRRSVHALRALSVLCVVWYERLIFRAASRSCNVASSSNKPSTFTLTLLADPQIVDRYSYDHTQHLPFGLSRISYAIVRWAADTYVRKSYNAVVQTSGSARSDAVIWLGDLLDGGRRHWDEKDGGEKRSYKRHVRRFQSLFPERAPTVYVPGNHDVRIPITSDSALADETQEGQQRWLDTWGTLCDRSSGTCFWSMGRERTRSASLLRLSPSSGERFVAVQLNAGHNVESTVNAKFDVYLDHSSKIPSHEILLVDALQLAGMIPANKVMSSSAFVQVESSKAWQEARSRFPQTARFVEQASLSSQSVKPLRVLISHIPLWRPSDTSCTYVNDDRTGDGHVEIQDEGWHRETVGQIEQGVDRYATYQNTLSRPVTEWLLQSIKPDLIFSGDNHDHCHVRHAYRDGINAHELTLKAFSMTGGVHRPGYARLSLMSGERVRAVAMPCALPDQVAIWTTSYPLVVLFFVVMLVVERFLYRRLAGRTADSKRAQQLPTLTTTSRKFSSSAAATQASSLRIELMQMLTWPLLAWLYFQLF